MSNIELVIKIDEDDVHRIVSGFANEDDAILFAGLLQKGIPLPKGHGKLKDVDHYIKMQWEHPDYSLTDDEPTIIEEDNTEREN